MDEVATTEHCSSSFSLVHPLSASFLGLPLELRESIYDLVAAQSETVVKVRPEKTVITHGYEPMLLLCKQVSNEFLRVTRSTETLRCDMGEEYWPGWRLQKIESTVAIALGSRSDSIRVLKTSLKPDESTLWYIVDQLPVLQELHVRLPDEDFDFDLDEKHLNPTTQEGLERLTVPYFERPYLPAWLWGSLMIHAGRSPAGREMLDSKAQRVLEQVVGRGLKICSHVDLYTLPVRRKATVNEHGQKLRQKWNIMLDGTSGKLISRTLGKLCWRNVSCLEQWALQSDSWPSLYRSVPSPGVYSSLAALRDAFTDFDTSSTLHSPQHPIMERYANLIGRKKPHATGTKKAGKGKHILGRLTFSKGRNLQARML